MCWNSTAGSRAAASSLGADAPHGQVDGKPRRIAPTARAAPDPSTSSRRSRALTHLFATCRRPSGIAQLRREIAGKIVFTTSFGLEDQAILHLLPRAVIDIDVVTLDTGRLFPETYELWAETERRYGRRIRAFYPRTPISKR